MSKLISLDSIQEMTALFQIRASDYWDNHYVFDKESSGKSKHLGKDAAQLLIINAVLPFMFNYGSATSNDQLSNKALSMFEALPGERNSIITGWKAAGLNTSTAWSTQALMHLKGQYCDKRVCLKCRIGNMIIKDPEFCSLA
jgi:hypothetical protein